MLYDNADNKMTQRCMHIKDEPQPREGFLLAWVTTFSINSFDQHTVI